MKALITGAAGFVGVYLAKELEQNGVTAVGMDLTDAEITANLLNAQDVLNIIEQVAPDYVFHLAGQSSVGQSWKDPQKTVEINVLGTLNLLDAIRDIRRDIRVVVVGSSDEYGRVKPQDCPITESMELNPVNPYAVSKVTQEQLALLYQKAYNLDVVATRSFNHTGPGQKTGFVIPDFASQISDMEKSNQHEMYVGNLEAKRDFSDVRDIVHAYYLLACEGKSGEVYNVGSGTSYRISDILGKLVNMSDISIEVKIDQGKFRPIDLPVIQSDITKLLNETGYEPCYSIDDTLRDTLDYWRKV